MSNLKKIGDEERESKFGYVYAVSGPGKWQSFEQGVEPLKKQGEAAFTRTYELILTLSRLNSLQ